MLNMHSKARTGLSIRMRWNVTTVTRRSTDWHTSATPTCPRMTTCIWQTASCVSKYSWHFKPSKRSPCACIDAAGGRCRHFQCGHGPQSQCKHDSLACKWMNMKKYRSQGTLAMHENIWCNKNGHQNQDTRRSCIAPSSQHDLQFFASITPVQPLWQTGL